MTSFFQDLLQEFIRDEAFSEYYQNNSTTKYYIYNPIYIYQLQTLCEKGVKNIFLPREFLRVRIISTKNKDALVASFIFGMEKEN